MQNGQSEESLPLWEKALSLTNDLTTINWYGEALIGAGKFGRAIDLLEPISETDWLLSATLARALFRQGQLKKAQDHYQSAIDSGPPVPILFNEYANLWLELGEEEKAIEFLYKSLQLDNSQYHLHWRLARIFDQLAQYEKTLEHLEKAQRVRQVTDMGTQIERYRDFLGITTREATDAPLERTQPVIHRKVIESSSGDILVRVGLMEKVRDLVISGGSSIFIERDGVNVATLDPLILWDLSLSDGRVIISNRKEQFSLVPPIRLISTDSTSTLAIYDVEYGSGYFWANREARQYRGSLELLAFADGLTIVNVLPLEEYLYSVVPGEMNPSWPLEALKAQAVAARTYTVFSLGRYRSRGFDLLATVASANYPGVTREHAKTTQAVNETKNEILTYNGNPIDAVYSANNGGIISSSDEVWGGSRPYLSSQWENPDNVSNTVVALERFLREDVVTFSQTLKERSQFRWSRAYSRQELETLAPPSIGTLIDVRIMSRGSTGRVQKIEWVGDKSRLFVTGDSVRSSLGGLRSSLFVAYPEYKEGKISALTMWGAGWGHGVGLSQTGALGMANQGYSYREILSLYYPGTKLEKKETN